MQLIYNKLPITDPVTIFKHNTYSSMSNTFDYKNYKSDTHLKIIPTDR